MRPGFGQFKFPSSEYLRFAAQYGVKDILLNTPVLEQSRPGVWSKKELIKLRLNIESYGLQLSAIENVPTNFYDHIMLGGEKSDQQKEYIEWLFGKSLTSSTLYSSKVVVC